MKLLTAGCGIMTVFLLVMAIMLPTSNVFAVLATVYGSLTGFCLSEATQP